MSFNAFISKVSVDKRKGIDDFTVTINLKVDEDAVEVFNKNYSVRYNSNTTISSINSKLQIMIISDWNTFLSERNIFEAGAFDTLVTNLQTAANSYMNP